jgi:hypothetical protein
MHTSYLVVNFLRKLFFRIIIVPRSPICAWHVLTMMAAVHDHDALRYWDIMHVITYHPDAPTFIAHQIFMVNGKDTVRGHVSLIDAEVVKFHQCISKCNIDFLIEKLSDIGARRIDHC